MGLGLGFGGLALVNQDRGVEVRARLESSGKKGLGTPRTECKTLRQAVVFDTAAS